MNPRGRYGLKGGLTELSLRFAAGRPAVTSSLVGHTSMEQLDASLPASRKAASPRNRRRSIAAFKLGPIKDAQLLWEIDRIHLQNRLPLFANDETGKDW